MKLAFVAVIFIFMAFDAMHASSPPVLKVAVTENGDITADGKQTTLEALIPRLRALATENGVVWYYRAAPESEPHPNALKVLAAIIEQKLPIRLSSKPDFSDAVDDAGTSIPNR